MPETLYFIEICNLFEAVQKAKCLSDKSSVFVKGFENLRQMTKFDVQDNFMLFYEGMRLIVPKMDHGRKSYNMKENKIARAIIKMLNLSDGPDKRNLLNFSRICCQNTMLDFADVVFSILRKYISTKESTLTVSELNSYLDSIANRDSDRSHDDIMLQMFRKLTSNESKWVIRIILKNLHLGIDNNRILNLFHKDAVEFYSSNNNLKKVCEVLWHPSVQLNEFNINLFEPFQPMLSKRCDSKSFTKDFPENKVFYIENKFDGERFQMHMKNGKFKYFSRNGYDYSDKFGVDYLNGILTPKLKEVFSNNVKSVILDGEMMLWNTRAKKFGSKGMTFDVKKLNNLGCYQPCFCVFDILFLNEKVLTNKELTERLCLLRGALNKSIDGVLHLSESIESSSRKNILDALNGGMDKEEEGIVVKDPKSIYKYKDRKSGWFKLKMEYFDDAVTDLDLVLMGGYYKSNSMQFNSFLVGVIADKQKENVLSTGRVSSGLNYEEMETVTERLNQYGSAFDQFHSKSKRKLIFGKDCPDIFIEPEKSLTFTIRATELIRSKDDTFRTPYTLRFPRILRVREDKSYNDCLSLSEMLELCQQNKAVIKLNKRHLELNELVNIKRQRKIEKLQVDTESLQRSGNFLNDLKFYVMSGREDISVDKIENLITRYGGTFTLTHEENINMVIAGMITPKIERLLTSENKFDVIRVEWLERVINDKCLKKYKQNEVLSIGTSFYNCLADDVDMYGDSFADEVCEVSLKHRMDLMNQKDLVPSVNETVQYRSDLPLFNKYSAYFDRYEVINDPSSRLIYESFLDEIEFRYRKGKVSGTLGPKVNLVVLNNENRRELIESFLETIDNCSMLIIERNKLYAEDEFEM